MRLTRCRVPAPRVRCSCPCDHVRGQLVWVVADQTPQRPAIAPASRPDRPSSWQGSMPRRPARERRPYLDEASTAVFRWAAFRRCAFGVEAFASAPLHECLGCGSSHSPEILLRCGRPRRRHRPRRPRRPRRRPRRPRRRPVPHVPPWSLRALCRHGRCERCRLSAPLLIFVSLPPLCLAAALHSRLRDAVPETQWDARSIWASFGCFVLRAS